MSHARDFALDGTRDASPQDRLAAWYSQGLSDGLGDRLLMFDNSSAPSFELLRFRPDLTARPGFEVALRERVRRLSYFRHDGFARVRAVEYLGDRDGLALVSNFTPGRRLSEVLYEARGPWLAASLVRQLTPALASLQAQDRGIFHAAVGAERIVVTPDGRLVIIEHVLGSALQRLELSAEGLADLGIVVPPSRDGATRLDSRTDFFQLAMVAVSLLLGRPVAAQEYPDKMGELLEQLASAPGGRTGLALRRWLERALLLNGPAFESAADAETASQALPAEVGAHQDDRLRALLAAVPDKTAPQPIASAALPAPRRELPPRIRAEAILEARPAGPVGLEPSPLDETQRAALADPPIEIIKPSEPASAPRPVPTLREAPTSARPQPPRESPPAPAPVAAPDAARLPAPPAQPPAQPVTVSPVRRIAPPLEAPAVPPSPPPPVQQAEVTPVPAAAPTPIAAPVAPAPPVAPVVEEASPVVAPVSADPSPSPPAVDARSDQPDVPQARRPLPLRPRPARKPAPKRRSIPAQWVTAIITGCAIGEGLVIAAILLGHFNAKQATPADPSASAPVAQQSQGGTPGDKPATPGKARGQTAGPEAKPADAGSVATIGRASRERAVTRPADRPASTSRSTGFTISSPIVLQVFEGDRLLGSTADGMIALPPGRREVDLVNTSVGYRARQTVYVRAGAVASIGVSLPSGRVSLNASPWAEVWIDGKSVGETPMGNLSVPIGEHEFVFRHPQLGERRQTATVRADGPTRVTADLRR